MSKKLLSLGLASLMATSVGAEQIVLGPGEHLDSLRLGPNKSLLLEGGTIGYLDNVGGLAEIDSGMLFETARVGRNAELRIKGINSNLLNGVMRVETMTGSDPASIILEGYNFRYYTPGISSGYHAIQGWLLDHSFIRIDLFRRGLMDHFELITHPGNVDADGDYDFDLSDLNAVRNNFGNEGPEDIDGNGVVDLGDLNYVRNYFGFGYVGMEPEYEFSGVIPTPRPVPEPNMLGLAVVASALAIFFGMFIRARD